jgi:hypothetical protein
MTPCSKKHEKHCSSSHADLVRSYRLERHRQEVAHEALTGGYAGDRELARANGVSLITFGAWLKANRRGHDSDRVPVRRGDRSSSNAISSRRKRV